MTTMSDVCGKAAAVIEAIDDLNTAHSELFSDIQPDAWQEVWATGMAWTLHYLEAQQDALRAAIRDAS